MGACRKQICTHDGFPAAKINIIIEEIPFCCSKNLTKLDNGKYVTKYQGEVEYQLNIPIFPKTWLLLVNETFQAGTWRRTNITKLTVKTKPK